MMSHVGGSQLFDLICLLILTSATLSLCIVPPGFIYYWLKDIIVNEFLKMSFLSASLEISERVSSDAYAQTLLQMFSPRSLFLAI
jgi:hypothetical protein